MKKLTSFLLISAALMTITACKKQIAEPVALFRIPDVDAAKLKINFASIHRNNPSVQIKLNNERVSNLITARTPFPGGGFNTGGDNRPDYLALKPGEAAVSISLPNAGTSQDSVKLLSAQVTLQSRKYYTLHTADTGTNIKTLLIEDDATNAPAGFSKYRFVNLIPDASAIDLYYGPTLVASNVPYLGNTQVFTMAVPATALAWTIRVAGSAPTSTALATYTSANTNLATRSYTAFAMGYRAVTSTSDVRRPFISFFLNQ